MTTATIYETKTHLSELLEKVKAGETIIITSGRKKTPVARLEPVQPFVPKRLGVAYDPDFVLPDSFWEPLSDEDCGLSDDPILRGLKAE